MLGIFLLFSLTFVNAQGVLQIVQSDKSFQITAPETAYQKLNQPYYLTYRVINSSDGNLMDETAANCSLTINSNIDGHFTFLGDSNYNSSINFWENDIPTSAFLELGSHTFYITCVGTERSGTTFGEILVTKTGNGLDTQESLIYIVLALGVFLLFALSFYFLISTPYQNEINEKGAIIKITKLKYVKLGLILLTWVLFTWLLNILIGLSDNFVSLTMYYGFFGFIFDVMNRLSLPLGIVVLVIALFELVRDANIYGNIKKFGSAYK